MLTAEPDAHDDLEIGQTSELLAIAQGLSSTYTPPRTEGDVLTANGKNGHEMPVTDSQVRLEQLQMLCAAVTADAAVSESVRSMCAALQHDVAKRQ